MSRVAWSIYGLHNVGSSTNWLMISMIRCMDSRSEYLHHWRTVDGWTFIDRAKSLTVLSCWANVVTNHTPNGVDPAGILMSYIIWSPWNLELDLMFFDSIHWSGDVITINLKSNQRVSHIMTGYPIGSTSKMGVQNGVTIIGVFGQYPLI